MCHPPGARPRRLLRNQNEAPGVGLEPTTSRLTAERVCQLSYPGSGYPGLTGRLGGIVRRRRDRRESDESGLDLGVTIRAQKDALTRLCLQPLERHGGTPCIHFVALQRGLEVVEVQGSHVPVIPTYATRPSRLLHQDLLHSPPSARHRLGEATLAAEITAPVTKERCVPVAATLHHDRLFARL